MVFSALGDLKNKLGQRAQAIRFEEMALRYKYIRGDPDSISISHFNMGNYLALEGLQSALDHRLAATAIVLQIGSGRFASALKRLAIDLHEFGPKALPGSFDQLCDRVDEVEGVQFRELWARLPKRAEDGDQLLNDIIEAAKALSKKRSDN